MKGCVKKSFLKSERCVFGDFVKRKDFIKYFENIYLVMLLKVVLECRVVINIQLFVEFSGKSDSEKNFEEIFEKRFVDFKEGVFFENLLFLNGVFFFSIRW